MRTIDSQLELTPDSETQGLPMPISSIELEHPKRSCNACHALEVSFWQKPEVTGEVRQITIYLEVWSMTVFGAL